MQNSPICFSGELSNHLGNVLAVVSDRKIAKDNYTFTATNPPGTGAGNYYRTSGADGYVDSYTADILSANDYFAFGALQPGRNFNSNSFPHGFGGQLKADEKSPGT
jgi:hypothetical protein